MSTTRLQKGPASHRALILFLNILLAVLVYWLLGFILDDIGAQSGPSWKKIQAQFQNATLLKKQTESQNEMQTLSATINAQREKQALLQNNIQSYRDTMNQLLDLQKTSLQKGAVFSNEAQQNLSQATKLYLNNQQDFQSLNVLIVQENEKLQSIQKNNQDTNTQLEKQNNQASEQYNKLIQQHNIKLALIKLLVLVPLLIVAAYFLKTKKESVYRSSIFAVSIALLIKIMMVMHEHFPSRFFKYILIVILILLVARVLQGLFRMRIKPQANWLQKQYKEAYKKLLCPICDFPIRPGSLKFSALSAEENIMLVDYCCPSCGTHLFNQCGHCGHVRHSLLSFCEFCGEKLTGSSLET